MKLSNEKILSSISVLKSLSMEELPIKVSYAIAKNINKLDSELKTYEAERSKLIDKYALKSEKGQVKTDDNGQIIFKECCKELWDKDIRELLAIENEIDILKFNINLLDSYNMAANELMLIDYMIEE